MLKKTDAEKTFETISLKEHTARVEGWVDSSQVC